MKQYFFCEKALIMENNILRRTKIRKLKENNISTNLLFLLKKHHLSPSQLANKLGLPWMTINRLISGETTDPRISTLKSIADYFNTNLEFFFTDESAVIYDNAAKPYVVPKLSWDILTKDIIKNLDKKSCNEWQTFTLNGTDGIGLKSFAIESRPSMYSRFPKGTIFIIDPETSAADGDIIMIHFLKNNEFALKELIIDPPFWRLSPLLPNSESIVFSNQQHEILGVNLLTLLYNQNLKR